MNSPFQVEEKQADQAKNSKILNRKQIQKRLQGLKTQEYQKIASNLQLQNEKLKAEVKNLSSKVEELVTSRKVSRNKNPQIQQQIGKLKRELDLKYQSMNHLKEKVAKAKQSDMTEQMKMKIKQYTNIVLKCQKQFHELQLEKQNLKAQISKNEADLEQFFPNTQNDTKMNSLRIENKQLKSKISRIKQGLTAQQKSSKTAIGKIYELKDQQKKTTLSKSSQYGTSLKQLKSLSINQINDLQKEIQSLKSKKKEIQKDLISDKVLKESKKSKLQKDTRQKFQLQKQLYRRRVKAVNQLNLFERRQFQLKHQLQKSALMISKIYQAKQSQTQKVISQQFRRQWAGKSQGILFNDAQILQYRGESLIKGVTVFKTAENIVFLKFHYQSPTKKKYQSQPPFQKFILKKCQAKKYQSRTLSALKGILASIDSQSKRLVRIELKWEDNDSSIIGWQVDRESMRLPFDIGPKEKPVCMFGTVVCIGKHSYVLESLGCEINTFDQ